VDAKIDPIRVHREEHDALKAGQRRLEDALARVAEGLARLEESTDRFRKNADERLMQIEAGLAHFELSAEERFERLEKITERLEASTVAFQRSTEERFARLEEGQAHLEEGQLRLEEGQSRLERSMAELADSRAQLERAMAGLAETMKSTRQEVGALSQTVGSDLEEFGRIVVAEFLRREEHMEIASLDGRLFQVDGEEMEIDIFGESRRAGETVAIIGECKVRVYPREVETFHRRSDRLARWLRKPAVRVIYAHRLHPEAERLAGELGILIVPWRYQHLVFCRPA
jgi:prefoldin subunit 5